MGSCPGFRKCKRISQMQVDSTNICGLRLQFAEFAFNLQIPQTVPDSTKIVADSTMFFCGFFLRSNFDQNSVLATYP